MSCYDYGNASTNVEDETGFSDVFIDVAGMYFESYQSHDHNTTQYPVTQEPNAEATVFINLVD